MRILAVLIGIIVFCFGGAAASKLAAVVTLWGHPHAADIVGGIGLVVAAIVGFLVAFIVWSFR